MTTDSFGWLYSIFVIAFGVFLLSRQIRNSIPIEPGQFWDPKIPSDNPFEKPIRGVEILAVQGKWVQFRFLGGSDQAYSMTQTSLRQLYKLRVAE